MIGRKGRVFRYDLITREMVRANRNTVYCFGDNMARAGLGGQAAACRGEPNAVGVPTKWRPSRDEGAYFTDADFLLDDVKRALVEAFEALMRALLAGKDVALPTRGLGTGLAELPLRAPKIHGWIEDRMAALERAGA